MTFMKTRLLRFMHTRLRMLFKNRSSVAALAAVLLAFGLTGCGDSRRLHEDFDIVERVVTDHPDSALRILGKIARPERLSKPDRARYDLLMAEARYMADSIDTVPTRLLEAASFFDREEDSHNAARAYYYSGIQLLQKKDYGHAIVNFLKADKRTRNSTDYILNGKINREIADCYEQVNDWKSALHFRLLSHGKFSKAGITKYTYSSILNVARDYFANEKYDSCITYLNNLYQHGSAKYKPSSLSLLGRSYLSKEDYTESISKFEELLTKYPSDMDGEDYMHLGLAYLYNGEMGKALEANRTALAMDSSMRTLDFRIATRTGDIHKAYQHLSEIAIEQYNWMDAVMYENYNSIISDYYLQAEEEATAKLDAEKRSKLRLKIVYFMIFIFLSFVALSFILKLRKERGLHMQKADALANDLTKMQRLIEDMESELSDKTSENIRIKESIEERDNEICRLGYDIRNLKQETADKNTALKQMSDKLELEKSVTLDKKENIRNLLNLEIHKLDQLCRYLYSKPIHLIDPKVTKVIKDASAIFADEDMTDILKKSVNHIHDDVLTEFQNAFPKASDNDLNLFFALSLGLSTQTICLVLNIKPDTLYSRKNKLKTRIANSDSVHKEKFLLFF